MYQDGIVRWFDNLTGTGIIRVGEDNYKLHYSAILKSFYEPRQHLEFFHRMLFAGQKVKVKIYHDSHWSQIDEVL